MNKRLKAILNLLQQSESLTPEEKKSLGDAVNESDKEISIIEFKLERTEKVKRTTAVLLEQTIAELEQKRKSVEAQNRELEIEASLERVRARTMAMHHSSELSAAASLLFEQLTQLGAALWTCGFAICERDKVMVEKWMSSPDSGKMLDPLYFPYTADASEQTIYESWKNGAELYSEVSEGAEIWKNQEALGIAVPALKAVLEGVLAAGVPFPKWVKAHAAFHKYGYLLIVTTKPFEETHVFVRFAKVFEQTYTRFLDLQKAEAQAREAQIEAVLERVRSRTMAMQMSEELTDVAGLLFEQVSAFGIKTWTAGFNVWSEDNNSYVDYITSPQGGFIEPYTVYTEKAEALTDISNARKSGVDFDVQYVEGEKIKELYLALTKLDEKAFEIMLQDGVRFPSHQYEHFVFGSKVSLMFITYEPVPEAHDIFKRLGKVFEQTYTRFLDLQKAEAQAREAQIETALEKVRSRSLAMHHSEELKEVVATIFEKLKELGLVFDGGAGVKIFSEGSKDSILWVAVSDTMAVPPSCVNLPYVRNAMHVDIWHARENGTHLFNRTYSLEEKNEYFNHVFAHNDYKAVPQLIRDYIEQTQSYTGSEAYEKNTAVVVSSFSRELISEKQFEILKRFSRVFEQAYTRFLDLQKAEAQAREAQIELALERVRARTMAMQKSSELAEAARLLYDEFRTLDINTFTCGYCFINEEQHKQACWVTLPDGTLIPDFINFPLTGDHVLDKRYEDWKQRKALHVFEIEGKANKEHHRFLASNVPDQTANEIFAQIPDRIIFYCANFSAGYLFIIATEFLPNAEELVITRFAKVFEQTYTRFLDLQKAEAQAREAQIEAALERVRSRTMAMQKSDELADVAGLMFQQVRELGYTTWTTGFNVWSDDNNTYTDYVTSPLGGFIEPYTIDATVFPSFKEISDAKKSGKEFYVQYLEGEVLKQTYLELSKFGDKGQYVKMREGGFEFPTRQFDHFVFLSNISLMFITYDPVPEAYDIFKRFGKVFEQTYTRFLDLQKAEAQAREAKIEASLERVRSKTMAMHNSHDVGETVVTMFDELVKLGVKTNRCGVLIHSDSILTEVWTAKSNPDEKATLIVGHLDITIHPMLTGARNSWAKKESFFSYALAGEDMKNYYRAINDSKDYRYRIDIDALPAKEIHSDFHFREGSIFAFTAEPIAEDASRIFSRFASVFGQTYTRFLDLQKAEAQTREAQIEAALERIRSRALAMHSSTDLIDVANVLREQMGLLGQPELESSIVHLYQDNSETFEAWYAYRPPNLSSGKIISGVATVPWESSEWSKEVVGKYGSTDSEYTIVSTGEKIKEWYKVLEVAAPAVVEYDHEGQLIFPEILYYHFSKFSGGALLMISNQQPSAEARELQRRAAVVFGLAVTRFFDLKRTEEQAREAQIEASLERVRGKAMAMHSSEDLAETIGIFYRELESFSIAPRRCGVGVVDKETRIAEISTMNTTDKGDPIEVIGKLRMEGHPVLEGIFDSWILQQEYHPVLRGNEIKEYYQLVRPQISFPEYPNDAVQFGYFFPVPELSVYAWTDKELAEDDLKIYRRFTSVLSLTHKRYKDLKDAEFRAKEAVKQATIDRVRAEIASMRTKQDLDRITPLIWNELTILGIPFVRCGVFIMDDKNHTVHTFLSTPDGKAIAAFQLDYSVSNLKEAIRHWHDRLVYVTHWGETEFGELADILMKQGSIVSRDQYLNTLPTEGIHLHFLPFLQGMLYVGNITRLQQDDIHLLQSVAEAFSTAYARYEDFNKLEAAKQQVDQALVELKQTQQQLVQSEKMASLGELTAGIAHEIQNPLNFVNNFSEVSNELIEEMVEEVKKGNFDEAKIIANDLKQNLEKINHHGKRADGIVKSMLQHSRTSSGQKELTDINVLCDEYLRLSYHGLRAKDKSFNAKFETDFDSTLEKINVIPQDIGRVILNLINNAFYAVTEKRKVNLDGYEPTVSVSTKQRDGNVEIKVRDNGNGIPDHIKEKIFQPFFTTKPTGQGTGLGLSLSYDIIKAHGGELKVETKEGEGSKFIIQLPG